MSPYRNAATGVVDSSDLTALLLAISRSLLHFEDVDNVVPLVLELTAKAVPVHTAVMIGAVENHTILRAWRGDDVSAAQLDSALGKARASYERYFAEGAVSVGLGQLHDAQARLSERRLAPRPGQSEATHDKRFIMLPLVVAHQPVFGALQIECAQRMDEDQLAFVNTVVNLLAIALDRHVVSRREIAARERAQQLERETADLLRREHDLLQREHAALEVARKAIGTRDLFLGIVSHDLRDMAGAAHMAVQLLLRTPTLDPARRQQLVAIERATIQMRGLLQDLLDTAAIDEGGLSLVLESCSVAGIANNTRDVYQAVAEGRSVNLVLDLAPDLPMLRADPRRLGQVLDNLVKNAIRFSPEGGTVTIGASAAGDLVRITVRDEGPGIALAKQQLIFDRYWTGRSAGTGLGLFIVKSIIEKHGGTVGVSSAPGAGTTMWVTIPVSREAPAGARP